MTQPQTASQVMRKILEFVEKRSRFAGPDAIALITDLANFRALIQAHEDAENAAAALKPVEMDEATCIAAMQTTEKLTNDELIAEVMKNGTYFGAQWYLVEALLTRLKPGWEDEYQNKNEVHG